MKSNTVILAPHSYVVVHRKQPSIYDVYEIETGKWVLSRTNPDNILRMFSEWCCTFKFVDENVKEIYESKEISDTEQKQSKSITHLPSLDLSKETFREQLFGK